ncbi:hypothetical protein R1sor_012884 [Riccia sorocarpa]|uniref:Uncharacterized protein n=1 Tax=Riccia sorocarpa TaxID=122646 RepID=A0ABD3I521_9MARC
MRNDEEKKKWKRTAEVWTQWFQPPKSMKDHACTSAKYKACDSMSDNTIRFISKDSFTRRDETTRLGVGGAGHTHRVVVVDEKLVPVLGAHDVVHYALKIWHGEEGDMKIHEKPIGRMIVGWVSGNAISIAIFIGRMFFYIFLHGIGMRRSRELTLEETMRTDRYRPHQAFHDEEKREYNQAVYTRGLHIPNAAEVHGRLLREGLEKMMWKKICHHFRNQRRTMDFWAHYFNEQLFIDLVTCARPIEYGPRAKVHPDGPQKVSRA